MLQEQHWILLSMGMSGDFEAAILEGATMCVSEPRCLARRRPLLQEHRHECGGRRSER